MCEVVSSSANGLYDEYRCYPDIDPMDDVIYSIDCLLKEYFDSYSSVDELKKIFDERLDEYLSKNKSKSSFDDEDIPF